MLRSTSTNKVVAASRPEVLAAELRTIVAEFIGFFTELFSAMDNTLLGTNIAKIAQACLDSALYKSNKAMIGEVVTTIVSTPRTANRAAAIADLLTSRYGFDTRYAREQADYFVATATKSAASENQRARSVAEDLSRTSVDAFIAQTAHVLMGRLMLYRVAEDEGMLPACFSGAALRALVAQSASGVATTPPILDRVVNQRAELDRFLPSIYTYGEFDWWSVPADKRAVMEPMYRAHLATLDIQFEMLLLRSLERLDLYDFRGLNVDVWHTVYQSYLPPAERQRLGGFYTPEPLVGEVLDEIGYRADEPRLCEKTFVDPACGSGTFVVVALRRLLEHLSKKLPCHTTVRDAKTVVERETHRLDIIMANVAAVDIHPFATFLTNVNVLFQVLVPYLTVKRAVPLYSLDLKVFAIDALDREMTTTARLSLFRDINSRIQLSEVAFRRQKSFVRDRFDFIFGNPPWGGVTKKKELAPVYDELRKREVRKQFPIASTGKFDIFGAFIELAMSALEDQGRCGFVIQNTLLDKDWSADLRARLASEYRILSLVDLSKFGGAIFGRLNAPITMAFERADSKDAAVSVVTTRDIDVSAALRLQDLVRDVRLSLETKSDVNGCVYEARPASYFKLRGSKRWDLHDDRPPATVSGMPAIADIYGMDQGVTPGGSLDIFMQDALTDARVVETQFRFPSFKSIDIEPFAEPIAAKNIIYPYLISNGQAVPAFSIMNANIGDALDFSKLIDAVEKDLSQRYSGMNLLKKILQHRIASGLVEFPELAQFLLSHYERLATRKYKKMPMEKFRRRWYEYIWPRDSEMLFRKHRLISPKIPRRDKPRFGFDSRGMISDDGTLFIYRHNQYSARGRSYIKDLERSFGFSIVGQAVDLLLMIWLNSAEGFRYVSYGKQITAKGSIQITDDLADIPLPRISRRAVPEVATVLRALDYSRAALLSRRSDIFDV